MPIPEEFTFSAIHSIKEYMIENQEWMEGDAEDFKEDIVNGVFNGNKFFDEDDCKAFVGRCERKIQMVRDYVEENDEFEDKAEGLVAIFNRCWYFSADVMYVDEEWDSIVGVVEEMIEEINERE